jgi:hypothetical protein
MKKLMKNVKNEIVKGLDKKETIMLYTTMTLITLMTFGFYGLIIKLICNMIF